VSAPDHWARVREKYDNQYWRCSTYHRRVTGHAGDPAPNAPKWFTAIEMIRLATDQDWLHKAIKEIAKHWKNKRERRRSPF
jgi:hypothetical protein